jgi:hypothetical protein
MLDYRPVKSGRHALGQFEGLTSGLTSGFAKQIVTEGEPVVRRIVKEERNRYAEALIGAIPFGVISALAFVGSKYLVPGDAVAAKVIGYLTSAAAAAGGAWWAVSHLQEEVAPAPLPSKSGSTSVDPYIQQTSQAIVAAAEPKVRAIVDDERRRIAQAGMMALPFGVGALGTFLATLFLVDPKNTLVKAVGYTGTTLLVGAGAWFGLKKELEAV